MAVGHVPNLDPRLVAGGADAVVGLVGACDGGPDRGWQSVAMVGAGVEVHGHVHGGGESFGEGAHASAPIVSDNCRTVGQCRTGRQAALSGPTPASPFRMIFISF